MIQLSKVFLYINLWAKSGLGDEKTVIIQTKNNSKSWYEFSVKFKRFQLLFPLMMLLFVVFVVVLKRITTTHAIEG